MEAADVRPRRCERPRRARPGDETLADPARRRPGGGMMVSLSDQAGDLAYRLGDQAEAVCRHYLSKGHREGRYWLVGDARNTPGRSPYVRLAGSQDGRGAAGKWPYTSTAKNGDPPNTASSRGGKKKVQ